MHYSSDCTDDEWQIVSRFKFVRTGFVQTILDHNTHWHTHSIVPNGLKNDMVNFIVEETGDETVV